MGRNSEPLEVTSMRREIVLAVVVAAVGCGESSSDGHPADAAADVPAEAGPVDPNCQDGMQLKSVPKGSCVAGASCAVLVEPPICSDGKWPPGTSPRQWYCECPSGSWDCMDNGSLNLIACEAGTAHDASSDAANDG